MTTCTTRAAETWAHMLAEVDPMPVCVALDFAQEGFTLEEARAAEDAAALAFLRLPESRRAALLKGEM